MFYNPQSDCALGVAHPLGICPNSSYNPRMRNLRQCLLDTEATLLHVIATRWEIETIGLNPRDLLEQVVQAIGDLARAGKMLDRLSPAERDALRALLAAGGTLPAPSFAQRFGSIRPVGPARLEREQPWRSPVSPAEGLWYLGLIYKGFEQLPNGAMREVFFAPVELAPLLPLLKVAERPIEPLALSIQPEQARSSGAALADDLCTLLSYLHNNFVRAQADRPESAARQTLDAIEPYIRNRDPARMDFLLHLVHRARLIKLISHRLRPDPDPSADWLRASVLDQLRILFEAWRTAADWSDLQHVGALRIDYSKTPIHDPVDVRAALLDGLRVAVPDAWPSLDYLTAHVKAQSPSFLRPEFDAGYVRDVTSGEYLRGFAAWDRIEGTLLRYVLTGPLYWLGAVDLGDDADFIPRPAAFRLTLIGAALLGIETADRPPLAHATERFFVQANAMVKVDAARRYDRFQLARIADLSGVSGDEYEYRITPSSLARAASQKIGPDKAIEFLARVAERELPPSLVKAIERWASKGAEVKVERAVIVRVKDEAILKRLQESPKTKAFVIEALGPTSARISERDWPKLVSLLAELGVLVDE